MADLSDDIARNVGFARCRDAYRLVIFDVDARLTPGDHLPVAGDHVPAADLVSKLCDDIVDSDASRFDQPVGFAARADSVLGKELVDANGVSHGESGLVDAPAGLHSSQDTINQPGDTKLGSHESFDWRNLAD